MKNKERRFLPVTLSGVELRSDGDTRKIVGHAAKYNSRSELLFGAFVEVIAPGTFERALKKASDVRALIDHDPSRVLGRLSAGTLRLKPDDIGLGVEIDPPDTSYARDLVASMSRGDIDGMSFGFKDVRDEWSEVEIEGCVTPLRTLTDLTLIDVSVVTFPAYAEAGASLRSLQERDDASLMECYRRILDAMSD